MAFETTSVALDTIDLTDHTYRVSTLADPAKIDALAESIDRLGLIRAPLILDNKSRRRIVSGFQRMAACYQLGLKKV